MKKIGQIKIQEMVFMLVAVGILFAIAALFAFSVVYSSLNKKASSNAEEKALGTITNLADSPEFSCTNSRENCIDSDKLIALTDRKEYSNFWPLNSLYIIKADSFNKTEDKMIDCTLDNYPNCDRFVIVEQKSKNEKTVESYVALCGQESVANQPYEKCEIAKVIAGSKISN